MEKENMILREELLELKSKVKLMELKDNEINTERKNKSERFRW